MRKKGDFVSALSNLGGCFHVFSYHPFQRRTSDMKQLRQLSLGHLPAGQVEGIGRQCVGRDEPAAGARVKTSVERRRPTAFRDGGRLVFLFKTGKYWNGKGRNIPYKWRFKSRNLAQRPKLRFGCLTKRR